MHVRDSCFHVGLSAWIIQDGNYDDFECGGTARFALEFYSEKGLAQATGASKKPGLTHLHDSFYEARGVVCFCSPEVWVVDFGEVTAFCERRPPKKVGVGVPVAGRLHLGIDPYFYFEYLHKVTEIPSLIYDWRIERIEMETAPFIWSYEPLLSRVKIRDPAKLKRVPVARTDAWKHDDGNADYVLVCRRISDAAHRSISDGAD